MSPSAMQYGQIGPYGLGNGRANVLRQRRQYASRGVELSPELLGAVAGWSSRTPTRLMHLMLSTLTPVCDGVAASSGAGAPPLR